MTYGDGRLPYPGLRSFNRNEADLFFGRDAHVNQVIDRLSRTRFLAVLGASGTGKSSLVRTGMLDGLEVGLHPAGANWRVCDMTPGGQPMRNLATGLLCMTHMAGRADPEDADIDALEWFLRRGPRSLIEWMGEGHVDEGTQVLVLVDQFEELFRFAGYAEREAAEAFVKLLIHASRDPDSRIHVVITMRSEYLGACVLIPDLAETINAGTYLTPRMSREQCEQAIVGPARMFGARIEPPLVNRLLNDLVSFAPWDDDPSSDQLRALSRRADQLPVMQHVLNLLWKTAARDDAPSLTLDRYQASGGLQGALNLHGEELLAGLGAERLPAVEKMFRALVEGSSTITATRRALSFADLAAETGFSEAELRPIVEAFRSDDANFLRPPPEVPLTSGVIIDIAHESLIRQWSRLSEWMTEEARAASVVRRVAEARQRYVAGEGDLLSGLDLANILDWWRTDRPAAAWGRRYSDDFAGIEAYLRKSEETETARLAERATRDRRHRRRLQAFSTFTSAIAIGAAFFFLDARTERAQAEQARNEAVEARTVAEQNQAQMLDVTESLGTDFAEKLENDATIPAATKLGLINDVNAVFAALAEARADDPKFVAQRTSFLLASLDALNAGGYWLDTAPFAEELERLVSGEHAGWTPERDLELRAALALADYHRIGLRQDRALAWLSRADTLHLLGDPEDPQALVTSARLRLGRLRLAQAYHDYPTTIAVAEDLLDDFERLYDAFGTGGPAGTGEPQSAASRAYSELARSVVDVIGSAQTAINRLDYHDRFGTDTHRLEDLGRQALDVVQAGGLLGQREEQLAAAQLAIAVAAIANNRDSRSKSAPESVSTGIRILEDLAATDPSNRFYRYWLLRALVLRADYAADVGSYDQARQDIAAAEELALDLRLSGVPWSLRAELEPWIAFNKWNVENASGGTSDIAREYARQELAIALEGMVRDEGEDPEAVADTKMLRAYVDLAALTGERATYDDVAPSVQAALAAYPVDSGEGADDYYALVQRQYIHRSLTVLGSDVVGEDWELVLGRAIDEVERLREIAPDTFRWLDNRMSYEWNKAYALSAAGDVDAAEASYKTAFDLIVGTLRSGTVGGAQNVAYAVESAIILMQNRLLVASRRGLTGADLALLDTFCTAFIESGDYAEHVAGSSKAVESLASSITNFAENEDTDATLVPALTAMGSRVETALARAEALVERNTLQDARAAARGEDGAKVRARLRTIDMSAQDGGEGQGISWALRPMLDGAWRTLDDDEFERMYKLIPFPEDLRRDLKYLRQSQLSFYDNGKLVEAQFGFGASAKILTYLVIDDSLVFRLNGTSPPIHEANATAPIRLKSEHDVAAYLRMFMRYVNGEEGSYAIVEHLEDIPFAEDAGDDERQRALKGLRPLVLWAHPEKPGFWQATGTVYYGRALFQAELVIHPTGMVEMLNDNPYVSGLRASRISVVDRERGLSRDPVQSIDYERIGLRRHETGTERIRSAVLLSAALPEETGDNLRRDYASILLTDIAAEAHSNLANEQNAVAYEMLLHDVSLNLAHELALKAHQSAPDIPYIADTYGWALIKAGQVAEGVAVLEAAVAGDPTQAEIRAHLGQGYRLLGRIDDARSALQTAMALSPPAAVVGFVQSELAALKK